MAFNKYSTAISVKPQSYVGPQEGTRVVVAGRGGVVVAVNGLTVSVLLDGDTHPQSFPVSQVS